MGFRASAFWGTCFGLLGSSNVVFALGASMLLGRFRIEALPPEYRGQNHENWVKTAEACGRCQTATIPLASHCPSESLKPIHSLALPKEPHPPGVAGSTSGFGGPFSSLFSNEVGCPWLLSSPTGMRKSRWVGCYRHVQAFTSVELAWRGFLEAASGWRPGLEGYEKL